MWSLLSEWEICLTGNARPLLSFRAFFVVERSSPGRKTSFFLLLLVFSLVFFWSFVVFCCFLFKVRQSSISSLSASAPFSIHHETQPRRIFGKGHSPKCETQTRQIKGERGARVNLPFGCQRGLADRRINSIGNGSGLGGNVVCTSAAFCDRFDSVSFEFLRLH